MYLIKLDSAMIRNSVWRVLTAQVADLDLLFAKDVTLTKERMEASLLEEARCQAVRMGVIQDDAVLKLVSCAVTKHMAGIGFSVEKP